MTCLYEHRLYEHRLYEHRLYEHRLYEHRLYEHPGTMKYPLLKLITHFLNGSNVMIIWQFIDTFHLLELKMVLKILQFEVDLKILTPASHPQPQPLRIRVIQVIIRLRSTADAGVTLPGLI